MDTKKIDAFMASKNIAEDLEDEKLGTIGADVIKGYDVDLESRSGIDEINKEAMKLAKQVYEKKTFPWDDAANVKYPLITVASIQFASRALPELIPDEKIVNAKIVGEDEDGAKEQQAASVTQYMDWQLTDDIEGWLDGTDRLLHVLPITGTVFRKVYYDALKKKVVSQFLHYDDVVVNAKAANLKVARRVSHKILKYSNYAFEMAAADLWLDIELGIAPSDDADEDAPHLFIEQHCWLDLDEDGYDEPYVVTVHKETSKVVRIVARYDADSLILKAGTLIRIEPIQYFVKYPFIPNPDGGFYDIGFGTLLYPINSSINASINQLLDAGTLANTGGGFLARGVRIKTGKMKFSPGEWKATDVMGGDLRSGILPLPIKDPSQVLFQLLGFLVAAGKDISSVQEAMQGQKPGENVSSATVVALIEQGLKVFSGIYKRIFRSLTEEFKLIYRLDEQFLDEKQYVEVLDKQVNRSDFNRKNHNISPSADPLFSLDVQRVGKAEALMKISGRPGLDEDKITAQYLKAIKAPENLLQAEEDRPKPPPNPEMERIKLDREKWEDEKRQSKLRGMKLFAEIEELRAKAILAIAKAEGEEEGVQLDGYKLFLDEMGTKLEAMKAKNEQSKGTPGMENGSGNTGSVPGNAGNPQGSGVQSG